jgi:hypothetical protein
MHRIGAAQSFAVLSFIGNVSDVHCATAVFRTQWCEAVLYEHRRSQRLGGGLAARGLVSPIDGVFIVLWLAWFRSRTRPPACDTHAQTAAPSSDLAAGRSILMHHCESWAVEVRALCYPGRRHCCSSGGRQAFETHVHAEY